MELIPPPEWTEQAVCAQVDPEMFYPEQGENVRQFATVALFSAVFGVCGVSP